MDDIVLHHQVVIDKFCWEGIVGINAPYSRCSQIDLVWLFRLKEGGNLRLIG